MKERQGNVNRQIGVRCSTVAHVRDDASKEDWSSYVEIATGDHQGEADDCDDLQRERLRWPEVREEGLDSSEDGQDGE